MKKKIIFIAALLAFSVILASCSNSNDSSKPHVPGNYGLYPDKIPDKVTDKTFPQMEFASLEKIWGIAGKDVKNKDLSQLSLNLMATLAFDSDTKWPSKRKLPKGFSPKKWLEIGKDPGLNLDALHKQGYTGKGVSVAIIDKPILAEHEEIKDNIVYTKVEEGNKLHFHGLSCASILSGKTCGVAPESKLYYFAVPDNGRNAYNYITALNKLFEVNESLPQKDKIRLVSISDGIPQDDKELLSKWNDALKKAAEKGVVVIYSNNLGTNFVWGGCQPYNDRNDAKNCSISSAFTDRSFYSKQIIIPGDFRTTASNYGESDYTYWGEGGFSWAIPYLAGVYALGLQIDPDLSFDKFIELVKETEEKNADGIGVINPVKVINKVKEGKK